MSILFLRKLVRRVLAMKDRQNSIYAHIWLRFLGVKIGANCTFYGTPMINKHPQSEIIVGNNVMVCSSVSLYSSLLIGRSKLHALSDTSQIIIGDDCDLNGLTAISRSRTIEIGAGTLIAGNCVIMDSDFHHVYPVETRRGHQDDVVDLDVRIGESVWIGLNCIILKGVTIGRGSVIGAGSVVVRDIPPMVVAAGNPARVRKHIGERTGNVARC